jgi:transcriptional regulator of arginine metabolism
MPGFPFSAAWKFLQPHQFRIDSVCPATYKYTDDCIINQAAIMGMQKRFRQGQILKVISAEPISNQDELRRRLAHLGMRVTQATLSRDLRDLKLVKTGEGYRPFSAVNEETAAMPVLMRTLREFLLDIRPAQNLLVLKTPPSGAQPLAAAIDAEHWKEVAGTLAGDDTILIVTPSKSARATLQKRIEDLLR